MVMKTLSAGSDLPDLPRRNKAVSHGSQIAIAANGTARQATYTSKKIEVVLELPDIDLICGNNKGAKKLFRYLITEGNEKCLNNGDLQSRCFSFNLKDLVDLGMYTSI